MKKLFLGFLSSIVLFSCQNQVIQTNDFVENQSSLNSSLSGISSTYKKVTEKEPNYTLTLNNQGVQDSKIENIYRFGKVNNTLYRGGLPTDVDLKTLKDFGVKTVVSFRGLGDPTELSQVEQEKKLTLALGMKFLNIQIPFDKPVPENTIKEFFKAVKSQSNQPLYVHCKGGRDRTGTMVALYRMQFDKYTSTQAIEEMKKFTFNPDDYPIFTAQIKAYKSIRF